jgi:hypothetical protein
MNYYFLLAGLVVFLFVIGAYLYARLVKVRQEPDLGEGVSLFLSCNGIGAGSKVVYLGLLAPPGTMLANDRIYILLGGLAVIWVSVQSILRTIYLQK